jgi:hypothetical protein
VNQQLGLNFTDFSTLAGPLFSLVPAFAGFVTHWFGSKLEGGDA